jgi:Spy/CpxP family protein refolding chaperone
MVPRGPLLDRLLDQAQASPTQRAQAHQIFDAADADLREQRRAERADRAQMAQLFAQPTIDAAAVEAVRSRIEQRHDLESRRATQALIDVGLVLTPQQRQAIASQLADGPARSAPSPNRTRPRRQRLTQMTSFDSIGYAPSAQGVRPVANSPRGTPTPP